MIRSRRYADQVKFIGRGIRNGIYRLYRIAEISANLSNNNTIVRGADSGIQGQAMGSPGSHRHPMESPLPR